jgi:chemotaxis protein CheX
VLRDSAFDSALAGTPAAQIAAPAGGWGVPLAAATREVFAIMLGTPLSVVSQADPPLVADLTAMVGLTGRLRGVLSMHCTVDAACRWATRMLGHEVPHFNQGVRDAIGEICNMIAGHFRTKLPGVGEHCLISTPTVICGTDYQLHSLSGGEHMELAFTFEGAPLWVTLDLRN